MHSSNNNLVRMALMGSLHNLGRAISLLDDEPWLQAHVHGDGQLLVDILVAAKGRGGVGAQPIVMDTRAHQDLLNLGRWLDRAGCDVWARNDRDRDAFDLAVECGCARLVEWMGQHPNRPDDLPGRWTARNERAMDSNPETVRVLAKLGFDPNATNSGGNTSLHMADNAAMVHALMDIGADPSITNDRGEDARAYWDSTRQATGEHRIAMDQALAEFEKPDPQRVLQEFSGVVQRQGITQAMHRLGLCEIDIATARWQGFTMPELMVARALNYGLSEAPILGDGNIKDMTSWFKRCVSVLGHYQKNGGVIDSGIVSAFSILQRLGEHAKNHSANIHGDIYKSKNEAIRKQFSKYDQQVKAIVPDGRKHLLSEDCAYLDRAVDKSIIKVGSPLAACLAMAASYTQSQNQGAVELLDRSLREHWDGKWNAYRFQLRGMVSSNRGRYNLIDRVPDIFQNEAPDPGPRTAAMILGIFANHAASRDPQASWTLLDMAEQFLQVQGRMEEIKDDPLVVGCLHMVDGLEGTQAAATLGVDTLGRVRHLAQRMRAMAVCEGMEQATAPAHAPKRGMGRL